MIEFLSTVPHCGLYGKPGLAALHIFGDLAIFVAYMAIPVAIEIVRRKRQLRFNSLAALFSAFIFLCGAGHLLDITAMLWGWWWLEGVDMALTGAVSLLTAFYAFKLIPKLVKMPTFLEYDRVLAHLSRVAPEGWVKFYKEVDLP